jgi:hypothetical protein
MYVLSDQSAHVLRVSRNHEVCGIVYGHRNCLRNAVTQELPIVITYRDKLCRHRIYWCKESFRAS